MTGNGSLGDFWFLKYFHNLYRVRKKVFAWLPTVSWFGACKDFLPGAVYIFPAFRVGLGFRLTS